MKVPQYIEKLINDVSKSQNRTNRLTTELCVWLENKGIEDADNAGHLGKYSIRLGDLLLENGTHDFIEYLKGINEKELKAKLDSEIKKI